MGNLFQKIKDWYITEIGHYLRTFNVTPIEVAGTSGYYRRFGPDVSDINQEELEAMRRRFDRTAKKYA